MPIGPQKDPSARTVGHLADHQTPTLTHQETGPAKSVSKQHHIGTAPVRCTAKFYRCPGKCMPGPCPGGSEAARQPGPWPGASPFIPPSTVTARFSVALFTRNHREGNRYGIPHAGSSGLNAGERPRSRENRCVGGQIGLGSTPGHKTRPAAGRWAVCTERHQNTSLPNTSKIGPGRGSTVELLLPEHCCCYGGKPGCLWRPFWLFSTYKKQGGSKKYFFL